MDERTAEFLEIVNCRQRGVSQSTGWLTRGHYGYRDQLLGEIGFSSYLEYLASDLWRQVRMLVLVGECLGCNRIATQVHHEEYTRANLAGESITHLVGLCGKCHRYIEIGRLGNKLTPTEAAARLHKLKVKKARIAKRCGERRRGRGESTARKVL